MSRIRRKLVLVLAGLAMGLLGVEVLARVVVAAEGLDLLLPGPATLPPGLYVGDEDLGHVPAPGYTATYAAAGLRVPIRINRLGLRGPEPAQDSGGRQRWLALGDSFTLGLQVREDDHFLSHLSRLQGVEVFNAGVDAYSTWQALERYRKLDEALGTGTVLLVFFLGNDILDNRQSDAGPAQPVGQSSASWKERLLGRHSVLFASWRIWQTRRNLADPAHPERMALSDELWQFTRRGQTELGDLVSRSTEPALRELQSSVADRGDRLIVALAPPPLSVDGDRRAQTLELMGTSPADALPDEPARLLRELLDELGVKTCDLTPGLRGAIADGVHAYFTWEGHWTPAGHEVVATSLQSCLER